VLGLIQRVSHGRVEVSEKVVGEIAQGMLVLVGVQPDDTMEQVKKLGDKLLNYRIFADSDGKTNLSLVDIQGGLLLVPQFSLAADTRKGLRPSFSSAARPEQAQQLFNDLVEYCRAQYHLVEQGEFGADMQVSLCNDGPLTFMISV
jgi:D-tyrosyl-tRNA(Tyr) deacylase